MRSCHLCNPSGNTIAKLGDEKLPAPNQCGGLNILAHGHGGYWRVDGHVQASSGRMRN